MMTLRMMMMKMMKKMMSWMSPMSCWMLMIQTRLMGNVFSILVEDRTSFRCLDVVRLLIVYVALVRVGARDVERIHVGRLDEIVP
jgi:hypothetical protein